MGPSTLTGSTIGHYLVLEQLGRGGMGVVYKARDTRLGRLAALKVLRPDSRGGADATRRLLREAQTASALNHPNILTIYDIGTEAGVDYIAMELVEGGTLADLIASGPLPAERALRLAAQVADALTVAHAASIVHRDLKPSNVMMPASDRVKVVDFGLAKLTGAAQSTSETTSPLTAAGTIVGTAPYMSPEQASGGAVDARSDLFSLGTILYEMLAGRMPFRGDSAVGTLAAILKDTPEPIPGIRPTVAQLVDRCLRKDRAERFQSAVELVAAIEECLASKPGRETPSVAVLPFTNMTGVKEDDYLCEGLAEEIIDALTRIPGLRVIARTSAFAIGRLGLDVREAGSRLEVGTILEGSVRRAGSRVRVAVQLVSTGDGSHVWSERYDRELTDVLAARGRHCAGGRLRPARRVHRQQPNTGSDGRQRRRARRVPRRALLLRPGHAGRPGQGDGLLREGRRPRPRLRAGLRLARRAALVPGLLRGRAAARRVRGQHLPRPARPRAGRHAGADPRAARYAAQGARLQLARGGP